MEMFYNDIKVETESVDNTVKAQNGCNMISVIKEESFNVIDMSSNEDAMVTSNNARTKTTDAVALDDTLKNTQNDLNTMSSIDEECCSIADVNIRSNETVTFTSKDELAKTTFAITLTDNSTEAHNDHNKIPEIEKVSCNVMYTSSIDGAIVTSNDTLTEAEDFSHSLIVHTSSGTPVDTVGSDEITAGEELACVVNDIYKMVAKTSTAVGLFGTRRDADLESSDSSSSSDTSSLVLSGAGVVADLDEFSGSDDEGGGRKGKDLKKAEVEKKHGPVTKGELVLDDLPPIEELRVTIDDSVKMERVGQIHSIIDVLVMVQSLRDLRALNLDTILFVEGRKVLGQIFETWGPVVMPFYSIRFNRKSDIVERGISVGDAVYYAPDMSEFTHYVFIERLRQIKGSDASWENNNEPPEKYIEYSDDEKEKEARAKHRQKDVIDGQELNGSDSRDGMGSKMRKTMDQSNESAGQGGRGRGRGKGRRGGRGGAGGDEGGRRDKFENAQNAGTNSGGASKWTSNPFLKVWPPPSPCPTSGHNNEQIRSSKNYNRPAWRQPSSHPQHFDRSCPRSQSNFAENASYTNPHRSSSNSQPMSNWIPGPGNFPNAFCAPPPQWTSGNFDKQPNSSSQFLFQPPHGFSSRPPPLFSAQPPSMFTSRPPPPFLSQAQPPSPYYNYPSHPPPRGSIPPTSPQMPQGGFSSTLPNYAPRLGWSPDDQRFGGSPSFSPGLPGSRRE